MTTQEFFQKYNNKPIDFDGAFGFQCVDLYRQYCQEVLQISQSPPVVGAYQIWDTYLKNYFDRIPNTPTGIPELGDIIIWEKKFGGYGHVAIFSGGNANSFVSFDQNFPLNSVCHFQKHDYKNVLGWLKTKSLMVDKKEFKKKIINYINSL